MGPRGQVWVHEDAYHAYCQERGDNPKSATPSNDQLKTLWDGIDGCGKLGTLVWEQRLNMGCPRVLVIPLGESSCGKPSADTIPGVTTSAPKGKTIAEEKSAGRTPQTLWR